MLGVILNAIRNSTRSPTQLLQSRSNTPTSGILNVILAAFNGVQCVTPFTTTSSSYVTAHTVTGPGVLEFLGYFNRQTTGTADCRITIDGNVVFTGSSTNAALDFRTVVGAIGRFSGTTTSDSQVSSLSLGNVPFRTSLLVELKSSAGSEVGTIIKYTNY